MPLIIRHSVTKKIKEDLSLAFFFEIVNRPKGTFIIDFAFYGAEEKVIHVDKRLIERMTAGQISAKKKLPKDSIFGILSIDVPYGSQVDKIMVRMRNLIDESDWVEIPNSGLYEDVIKAAADLANKLKLKTAGFPGFNQN